MGLSIYELGVRERERKGKESMQLPPLELLWDLLSELQSEESKREVPTPIIGRFIRWFTTDEVERNIIVKMLEEFKTASNPTPTYHSARKHIQARYVTMIKNQTRDNHRAPVSALCDLAPHTQGMIEDDTLHIHHWRASWEDLYHAKDGSTRRTLLPFPHTQLKERNGSLKWVADQEMFRFHPDLWRLFRIARSKIEVSQERLGYLYLADLLCTLPWYTDFPEQEAHEIGDLCLAVCLSLCVSDSRFTTFCFDLATRLQGTFMHRWVRLRGRPRPLQIIPVYRYTDEAILLRLSLSRDSVRKLMDRWVHAATKVWWEQHAQWTPADISMETMSQIWVRVMSIPPLKPEWPLFLPYPYPALLTQLTRTESPEPLTAPHLQLLYMLVVVITLCFVNRQYREQEDPLSPPNYELLPLKVYGTVRGSWSKITLRHEKQWTDRQAFIHRRFT